MSAPVPMAPYRVSAAPPMGYTRTAPLPPGSVPPSVPSTPGRPVVLPTRPLTMSSGAIQMPQSVMGSYVAPSYKMGSSVSLDASTRSVQMPVMPKILSVTPLQDARVKRPSVTVAARSVQAAIRLAPKEVKTVVKPDAKPEVKPEVKFEAKPEVKPEVKPDVKPEVKPEVKPVAKPAEKREYMGEAEMLEAVESLENLMKELAAPKAAAPSAPSAPSSAPKALAPEKLETNAAKEELGNAQPSTDNIKVEEQGKIVSSKTVQALEVLKRLLFCK